MKNRNLSDMILLDLCILSITLSRASAQATTSDQTVLYLLCKYRIPFTGTIKNKNYSLFSVIDIKKNTLQNNYQVK